MAANNTVELIVGLKIPDTTAITALDTIHNMGFEKVKNLIRETYYEFFIAQSDKKFENDISKVDILINVNKNNFKFAVERKQKELSEVTIAVKNIGDNNESLLSTLTTNLGFKNINKIEKKILWTLVIDSSESGARKTAAEIADKLLTNRHFQEYEMISIDKV